MRALLQQETGGLGGRRDDDGMELRCNPLGRQFGEVAEQTLNPPISCPDNRHRLSRKRSQEHNVCLCPVAGECWIATRYAGLQDCEGGECLRNLS